MGKSEPTEEKAASFLGLSEKEENILLGTLTDEDGTKENITGKVFLDLVQKGLIDENPDPEARAKLEMILPAMIEAMQENFNSLFVETKDKEIAFANLNALRTLLDSLLKNAGVIEPTEGESEAIPKGTATGVSKYVVTKDLLSKAVFGEPGRDGKTLSIVSEKPGALTLWTTGKGKKKQDVAIYTQLEINEKALNKAGITIGRNLSKRAREVYGAMLSHYLAGNRILTARMIAKVIFNTSDNAKLTKAQEKYIIDGVNEVFLTTLFIDTTFKFKSDDRKSLLEENNIQLTKADQIFPGSFAAAYINGNLVKNAIVLRDLPALYKLQTQLERGQILKVPIDYLEIPGRIDEDLVKIRAYLLRRVDAMKHSPNLSQMIIFKNVLTEVGIDPTDRRQRNKIKPAKERTERILNHWKEKGHIKDYHELDRNGNPAKKNGTVYEIKVDL